MNKKRPPFQPVNQPPAFINEKTPYLTVGQLHFYKLGSFTVDEAIAFELLANNATARLIDIMVLAQSMSHDLNWTYQQSIDALNTLGNEITPELVGYADQIKEIGLLDFSDTRRKLDNVHQFILLRGYPNWTYEQSQKLIMPDLRAIHDFLMQEFYEWQKPPASEPDLGKLSSLSAADSSPTPGLTGENVTIISRPLESVTLDSMPATLTNS
jgi:hypothetical protein